MRGIYIPCGRRQIDCERRAGPTSPRHVELDLPREHTSLIYRAKLSAVDDHRSRPLGHTASANSPSKPPTVAHFLVAVTGAVLPDGGWSRRLDQADAWRWLSFSRNSSTSPSSAAISPRSLSREAHTRCCEVVSMLTISRASSSETVSSLCSPPVSSL